ncbi:NAD(P)-binding protein [Streptomyces sp. NPDC001443]
MSALTNASEKRFMDRAEQPGAAATREADVLVIGAGATGLGQLQRAREKGFSAVLLEAGLGVGGVWYWNRLDAERLDTSKGVFRHLRARPGLPLSRPPAGWPTIEGRLNDVVDRLGLRRDIRLGVRVASARYEEETTCWVVTTTQGAVYRARFLVAATGVVPVPAELSLELDTREDAAAGTLVGAGVRASVATLGRQDHESASHLGRAVAYEDDRDIAGCAELLHSRGEGPSGDGGGPLRRLALRGRDGLKLNGAWAAGARSYLGLMTAGFPNLFFPGGPHGVFDTRPGHADDQVALITGALVHARRRGNSVVEVALDAEDAWTRIVADGELSGEPERTRRALLGMFAAAADDEYASFVMSGRG